MSTDGAPPIGDESEVAASTSGRSTSENDGTTTSTFVPNGHVESDGWRLRETGFDADRAVAVGSNFMAGNGYLGYRATSAEQGAEDYVALVVTDTYDCADGEWRELTTAPNPLFVRAEVAGTPLSVAAVDAVEWSLDLAVGETRIRFRHPVPGGHLEVDQRRFASYDDLHLLAQRWTLRYVAESPADVAVASAGAADSVADGTAPAAPAGTGVPSDQLEVGIEFGIDADVWSLNGTHLVDIALTAEGERLMARGTTGESRVDVAVATASTVSSGGSSVAPGDASVDGRRVVRRVSLPVAVGDSIVVETVGAVASSNDPAATAAGGPAAHVAAVVSRAAASGYDALRAASEARWREIWWATDVRIEGSELDDAALRFSAYHNRICTPVHADHLPIGARGLSCQAYQGAAFWDQEVYNLPAFLFTEPDVARSILVYRHLTLDGARRKAQRLGYAGAYYAWISGTTGDELCPDYFFVDVLTGRPIRNHFNVWQMHVSPDIVTMLARYVDVTGDIELLVDHGAEIAFEVARFLHSFVRYDEWREVYHCIRLLGPDEWHENVDDNAFTNYQVRAALRFAIDTYELLAREHPNDLARIAAAIGLDAGELDGWRRVHDRIFLPEPGADSLIEQFDGFFELEDVTPAEVRTRLLHPQEYWGWPNGVAVATQVSKQADIAMLLWLHADQFDAATIRRNYEYYEARCAHGSSLSHAAHGIVAARLGDADAAHEHFRETALVDLANTQHAVVGGTFIGGIHTAACGGTYQLAVEGFGGLDVRNGRIAIDPVLPHAWTALRYPVTWRGNHVVVTVRRTDGDRPDVAIEAADSNVAAVPVSLRGADIDVAPGATITS